jgi:hypothetical protein
MLSVLKFFLKVFIDDMNLALEVEVTESKLQSTLLSMKKDKSLGPNGFTIEFYIGFYELLKDDLLKVVQESKRSGKLLGAMNSTFLALTPKEEVIAFEEHAYLLLQCCS